VTTSPPGPGAADVPSIDWRAFASSNAGTSQNAEPSASTTSANNAERGVIRSLYSSPVRCRSGCLAPVLVVLLALVVLRVLRLRLRVLRVRLRVFGVGLPRLVVGRGAECVNF
jgi:hypothetical protein